ncbi:serine hydrolase [Roseobacter sinensis]|uniref:Serine hydrolase n=1 Tax=Roseobacter sinensis TaxID=2931391 RepID=A0ABT3BAX5_9RHOB|nr:serine hydrolase [Roseobacter sp. WL0113]MCV3270700.1 serine hydrolase [Roseobacter sp. WL0113]
MPVFDLSALQAAPRAVIDAFHGSTPAPAVLMEIHRDGLSVAEARGVADLASGAAATTDHACQIGSQTKMMTGVVVLNLVASGAIDFDAPLADQMDIAGLEGIANIETVTVRQLLANRSGIPDFDSVPGSGGLPAFIEALLADPTQPMGTDALLGIATGQPAAFAPGEAYAYSNTNFLLLEKLVEQVTGQSFGEVLEAQMFTPAGMADTVFAPHSGTASMLRSYAELVPGQPFDVTDAPLHFGAAGGAVSTTGDMVRFMDALLLSKTLLPPEQLAQMLDFRAPDGTPSLDGESFGLSSGIVFGQQLIGFQGGTLGTNSGTFVHVDSGTIVTVAVSHSGAEPVDLLAAAFAAIFDDDNWASFDPDAGSFEIAASAAEVTLSEGIDVRGNAETKLSLDGVSLSLDGALAEFDADRFSFEDGSVLRIGSGRGDHIDILRAAPGAVDADNQLLGLQGNDHLRGGFGDDWIGGGGGRDYLRGRAGDDTLDGGAGSDRMYGDYGNDDLRGGEGADLLRGGHGADRLDGGADRDRLFGDKGDDALSGGSGDDMLYGGSGDDTLDGGSGNDRMWGGQGADVFVFGEDAGHDRIYWFDAERDALDFSATGLGYKDLTIESCGWGRVQISYGKNEIDLIGVSLTDLTEDVFIF